MTGVETKGGETGPKDVAALCDELLHVIDSIVGDAVKLLAEPEIRMCERAHKDLEKVRDCAEKLSAAARAALGESAFRAALGEPALSRLNHDLRNFLMPITGYAEDLHRKAPHLSFKRLHPELGQVLGHGRRAVTLVDQVLGLLRGAASVPARAVGLLAPPVKVAATVEAPLSEPGRLLVIDDTDEARDFLAHLLRDRGHQVTAFGNPLAALKWLGSAKPPDLVLLDIEMPMVNGMDILDAFKGDPELRDIPIIMVSGSGDRASVIRCLKSGAEDYVEKPFDGELLRVRVEACLESKRLRDQVEAERREANRLLNVLLPREIAAELKRNGRVAPRRHNNVAVLFADVAGFTEWSDRHEPEEVVARLQELVESWEQATSAHRMRKIKTIGDAYMATAGLLRTVDDPVMACVRCGLAMAKATTRIASDWKLRVGVHIGPIVAGVLGKKRYSYDLWGDTVNYASRVESNGEPGAVCLSKAAYDLVADRVRVEEIVRRNVKGIGDMKIYRVIRLLEDDHSA